MVLFCPVLQVCQGRQNAGIGRAELDCMAQMRNLSSRVRPNYALVKPVDSISRLIVSAHVQHHEISKGQVGVVGTALQVCQKQRK